MICWFNNVSIIWAALLYIYKDYNPIPHIICTRISVWLESGGFLQKKWLTKAPWIATWDGRVRYCRINMGDCVGNQLNLTNSKAQLLQKDTYHTHNKNFVSSTSYTHINRQGETATPHCIGILVYKDKYTKIWAPWILMPPPSIQ